MTTLEEIIARTTIDIPGKAHVETEDFKWLIERVERLEKAMKYPCDAIVVPKSFELSEEIKISLNTPGTIKFIRDDILSEKGSE